MFKGGANIPVAVAVSGESQLDKVFSLSPKLTKAHEDSSLLYNQILAQKGVYERATQRFKEVLGNEDFQELSCLPFWNSPKSDEFRSQFINNRRPIVRTLAQERFKLWELLVKYSEETTSLNELLQTILGEPQRSSAFFMGGSQPVVTIATTREFKIYITRYTKIQLAQNIHIFGCELVINVATDHIIEDDDGIRRARVGKFIYDRRTEFFKFLKSLEKKESDDSHYNPPYLCLLLQRGAVVSLFPTDTMPRDSKFCLTTPNAKEIVVNPQAPYQYTNDHLSEQLNSATQSLSLTREFIVTLQARGIGVHFNYDESYTISW